MYCVESVVNYVNYLEHLETHKLSIGYKMSSLFL